MAKKRIAHKIEIHVDPAGGTSYTKIAGVKRIGAPGYSRAAVNVDCLDTDVQDDRPDPVLNIGDLNLQIFWDEEDSDQQSLIALITGTQPTDIASMPSWKIVYNFATPRKSEFTGWLKDVGEQPYEVKNEVLNDVVVNVNTIPAASVGA